MNLSRLDIYAALSYIASGGLAATAVGIATFAPHYQVQILAASAILVGVAGMLTRLLKNPTPTNTAQVYDRTTGSTVTIATVEPPTKVPAPPPTYSKD